MKNIIILILFISLLSYSALANNFLYDDFSNGLDTNKWEEIPVGSFMTEHYVLSNEDNKPYHTASYSPGERGVILQAKKTFIAGETLDYDLNYISGSGNRISIVDLDNRIINISFLDQEYFGLYHLKVKFTTTGVIVDMAMHNGTITTVSLNSSGETHTFGFGTRTGQNGWAHMDYDNVFITDIINPLVTITSSEGSSIAVGKSTTLKCIATDDNGVSNISMKVDQFENFCTVNGGSFGNHLECQHEYTPTTNSNKIVTCTAYDLSSRTTSVIYVLSVTESNSTNGTGSSGSGSSGAWISSTELNQTWVYKTITELKDKVTVLEERTIQQETEINELKQNQTLQLLKIEELSKKVELLQNNTYTKSYIDTKLNKINSLITNLDIKLKKVEEKVDSMVNKFSRFLFPWWFK